MPQTFNVGARSPFVTGVAWLSIALALLGVTGALVGAGWGAAVAQAPRLVDSGPLTGWLVAHGAWVQAFVAAVLLAMGAAAVGLLARREWARRVFIALLGLALAAQGLGLWVQHEVMRSLVADTLRSAPLPPQAADVFGGFAMAAQAMAWLLSLSACLALVWVMQRLMSQAVRQEFA